MHSAGLTCQWPASLFITGCKVNVTFFLVLISFYDIIVICFDIIGGDDSLLSSIQDKKRKKLKESICKNSNWNLNSVGKYLKIPHESTNFKSECFSCIVDNFEGFYTKRVFSCMWVHKYIQSGMLEESK